MHNDETIVNIFSPVPVYYTHLDVYKRQIITSPETLPFYSCMIEVKQSVSKPSDQLTMSADGRKMRPDNTFHELRTVQKNLLQIVEPRSADRS